jgi:hypothetical protein
MSVDNTDGKSRAKRRPVQTEVKRGNHPPPFPLAVRRRQAALLMGVGVTTVDILIARGELKAKKLGKSLVILTTSIVRFLDGLPDANLLLPPHLRNNAKGED